VHPVSGFCEVTPDSFGMYDEVCQPDVPQYDSDCGPLRKVNEGVKVQSWLLGWPR